MSLRLLVIADRPEYRLLVRKHVEIEWPDAVVLEHRLGEDQPLDAKFVAAGYDAVIVVGAPPAESAEILASLLSSRADFAPLVLVVLQDAPPDVPPDTAKLARLYGKKVDRERLLRAITVASREQKKSRTALRSRPDFDQMYKFGSLTIRGHRCIRQVGSGGMCKIYLAESERAGAMVVLKVFSQVPDVSERLVGFDRFIQEYEIVAGLNHPNIVRIYDLGIADDHAYIAMEHFPAGDLRARMKMPLAPRTAVHFLAQIASALDAIHAVGVLHRDLKPANVMLRADGTLCLIDFGLAKANELEAELTGIARDLRYPLLHEPGARPCRAHRRAQRPVQPGRGVLRDADRPQAVHGIDRHGGHLQAQAGRASCHRAAVRTLRAAAQAAARESSPRTGFNRRASCWSAVAELKVPA